MAKRTLYEILGVAEGASSEDLRRAFAERRAALGANGDDDSRNQKAFLEHAHHVLSDPQRRAAYDLSIRPPSLPADAADAKRKRRLAFSVLMLLLLAALLLQPLLTATRNVPPPRAAPAVAPAAAKAAAADELPSAEDVAAALPEDLPLADAAPAPAAAPPPAAARAVVVVPGNPLMSRILQSTYAIAGSQGFGTGVAVEADRLLTNCHVIAPNVLKGKLYAISPVSGERFEITEAAFLVKEDACVVHAPGLAGQPMALGDTARLQRGARLHNIGFAGGRLTLAEGQYLGSLVRFGQSYMVSTNYCLPGVSGGPLVDDDGALIGLTSGGARDARGNFVCASLTVETARQVLAERMMQIDAFPGNYRTNWTGRR